MRIRIRTKAFRLIPIALLLVCLTGCGMQVFPFSSGNNITVDTYENAEKYDAGDFTYSAADVDAIEISWRSGNVELVESGKDTLSVSESGNTLSTDEQLHYWLNDRTLYIQFGASGLHADIDSRDKHLTLELPKGIKVSVKVTSAGVCAEMLEQESVFIASMSGNLELEEIVAAEVDLSSSSGRQNVKSVTANALRMASSSGNLRVESAEVTGEAVCDTTSGDITLDILEAGEADMETTSGYIDVKTLRCAEINMRSTSGWMRIGLPEGKGAAVDFITQSGRLLGDISWERVGDLYVFGDRTYSITAETTSGDLEIN